MREKRKLARLLFASILLSGSSMVMAQTDKPVTVQLKQASIRELFMEIKKQAKVNFMYSNNAVEGLKKKDYDFTNASLEKILAHCLEGTGLTFEIADDNRTVVIKRKQQDAEYAIGAVVDRDGMPLAGVSIKQEGVKQGTVTGFGGEFSLPLEPTKDGKAPKLIVSFIGMKTQRLTWEGRVLNIYMEDDAQNLDEVVVTGYQVINKRALTSAVTTVKAEDIIRPDFTSIDQMLEGHVTDLMFMSNSGEAGAVPKIRIRGTSSIIGNREPLWVVDGIVVNDPVQISPEELNDPDFVNRIGNAIAGLNPQDIERLDVLKDASATALYGSKAANGVIVITTKRGRVGKPEVRYTNSFTYKLRPRYTDRSIDVMNSKERIQLSRELYNTGYIYQDNISPVGYEGELMKLYNHEISYAEFAENVARLETMNTDWFDLLTHDSFSQQHTMSVSGGSETGRYYASIGYTDTDDVIKNTMNKRYTAALNLDANLTTWLSASFSMNGNVSKRRYAQESLSPVDYAYTANRAIPAYDADGNYYYYKKMQSNRIGYDYNILNELDNSGVNQDGTSLTMNANLRFKFNDWLSANAIASYSTQTTTIDSYWGDKTWQIAELRGSDYGVEAPSGSLCPQGGEFTTNDTRNKSWTVRLQLDWNKYFGDEEKHNFNGTVGYEVSSTRYKGYTSTARGYYPDRGLSFVSNINLTDYPQYGSWLASNVPYITDNLSNVLSAYASFTYSWNQMVYLNLNGRIDGSNNFGDRSNDKILPIWSVSGSFNFGQLGFMRELEWIDYLTVKGSYGFQGNMLNTESPVLTITKNPLHPYYNEFTASANGNPNPNLKWEKTHSYNIGLEASFFNNRVQLAADVYFKRTKDAFMSKTISTINGYSSYVVNRGNISNDGFNVDITVNPIMTKDWRWSISTSFSRTINQITSSPDGESYELTDFLNGNAVVKGQSIGTFYSYRFLGLSPVDGGPMFDDWEDHYEDLMGLSKYDTYTRVLKATGSREPTMAGGLNTTLRYKQFRFAASFAYSLGAKTRLFGMYGSGVSVGDLTIYDAAEIRPEHNMSRDYLDRWQHPGDEQFTNIPAIIGSGSTNYTKYLSHWSDRLIYDGQAVQPIATSYWDMYDYSDLRVVSANYLKCNNISLTYEFPKKLLDPWHITRLELTASGSNLFTIADKDLKGQTPTQGGFTTIQLSDRPSFSLGLSVTF